MNSGEKTKNDIETNEDEWGWDSLFRLEESPKDDFDDNVGRTTEKETPEERQKRVFQAKAKVKDSYRKSDVGEFASMRAETVKEKTSSYEPEIPTTKRRLSKYDISERSRVDRIKSKLNPSNIRRYEEKKTASRPNAFTKTVRLIADKLGIRIKRSEEQREREAIYIALNEYYREIARRKALEEEKEKAKALERERQNAELEAEKARLEKKALENDMASVRKRFDDSKRDKLKRQRIQELVERNLNSRLLKVDDLETEAISENPEIQKRTVPFEDVDIPVYDLKGLPFSILSTTVDYRRSNKPGEIGTETFKKILEDPSIWAQRRDEAEKASGFGTKNSDARGDTISASYWNSERNISSYKRGDLIYGFESVRADSIIAVYNGDGNTDNMAGSADTSVDLNDIKQLEGVNGTRIGYNEVFLRRYTENGMPKKPDYIIVENGRITKESLRHAKYFGVPIVNIEVEVYEERIRKRCEEVLTSIDENDTYEEIDEKITDFLSMVKNPIHYKETLKGIGRGRDKKPELPTSLLFTERWSEVLQIEKLKRLDFIKSTLEKAIHDIESATENGLLVEQRFPGFENFDISIADVQNQLRHTETDDKMERDLMTQNICNCIDIKFRLKGSSHKIETCVYDAERVYDAQKAVEYGFMSKKDLDNADSSFYDILEPVVLKYFEAVRKNKELWKNVA